MSVSAAYERGRVVLASREHGYPGILMCDPS
jgi:hypothetical protein